MGDGWPFIDFGVEIGLGETGIIDFLVAVFAIAIHVDDEIPSELLSKIERHLGNKLERNRVFAIHMQNGDLDHLGNVGRIHRRTRIFGQSGEPDLIVNDDVNGAAGRVTLELRHIEGFRHDPLPRESGVAMK